MNTALGHFTDFYKHLTAIGLYKLASFQICMHSSQAMYFPEIVRTAESRAEITRKFEMWF
jgi:hypothetical protein